MEKSKTYICEKDIPYVDAKGELKVIKKGLKFMFDRDLGSKVILMRWNKPFIVEKEIVREYNEAS